MGKGSRRNRRYRRPKHAIQPIKIARPARAVRPQPLTPEQEKVKHEFLIGKFYMLPEVMVEFAEWARHAQPNEIGGYCRVQRSGNNFIAVELKVFPQTAHSTYFEMDGMEIAKWRMKMLKEGRKEEMSEWNCLIHSHPPGCAPFLSGTDREQIIELGNNRHAWSIIVTANENIAALDWRVHFYHGGDTPFLVQDIPVDTLHPNWKEIKEAIGTIQKPHPIASVNPSPDSQRPSNGTPKTQKVSSTGNYLLDEIAYERDLLESFESVMSGIENDISITDLTGIEEGSVVIVDVASESLGMFDETVQGLVTEMIGEQFMVDHVDEQKRMFHINGIEFAPEDLVLVQE